MSTECRVRSDLITQELAPIIKDGERPRAFLSQVWHPCEQPDELDDEEFNLIISVGDKKILGASIDFEYREAV